MIKKYLLGLFLLTPISIHADVGDQLNKPCSPEGQLTIINEKPYKCNNHKWSLIDTSMALPYGQPIMASTPSINNKTAPTLSHNTVPQNFTNQYHVDKTINSIHNGTPFQIKKNVKTNLLEKKETDKLKNTSLSPQTPRKTHDLRNCFIGGFLGGRKGWHWHKHPLEGGVAGCWAGIATGRIIHH